MRPDDLPDPERHPHGTRARYVGAKCRCDACREANRKYYHVRAHAKIRGGWNGLVDAAEAREHLRKLSLVGIGRRAVHDATDISLTVIQDIKTGKKQKCRALVAKKILSVDNDAIADHSLVPAAPTWKLLRSLMRKGYTKTELAERLGSEAKLPSLQVREEFVLAKTAQRVRKLYQEIMEELALEATTTKICAECGFSHEAEDRKKYLINILPGKVEDIQEAWSCIYGGTSGQRMLFRDLKAIGAVAENGQWRYDRSIQRPERSLPSGSG